MLRRVGLTRIVGQVAQMYRCDASALRRSNTKQYERTPFSKILYTDVLAGFIIRCEMLADSGIMIQLSTHKSTSGKEHIVGGKWHGEQCDDEMRR